MIKNKEYCSRTAKDVRFYAKTTSKNVIADILKIDIAALNAEGLYGKDFLIGSTSGKLTVFKALKTMAFDNNHKQARQFIKHNNVNVDLKIQELECAMQSLR